MDEYMCTTQATIGSNTCTWGYDGNNMLSQINASGVQRYDYTFNVNTGNLSSRTNYLQSKTESFGYDGDNLDRLASVTGPQNLSVNYTGDKNGNISYKSDAGTYAYNTAGKPYAVSGVTNALNIDTARQEIDYYSFEKVEKITQGLKTADFWYNAGHQRIKMELKDNGVTTKTKYYFGGSCEREVVGGTTTQYIWIGGDAYTAVAVAKKVGDGGWTIYNIFRGHLGTITHLKNGGNVDEYSFDAWGRRRDKDSWSYTLSSEPSLFADRGFTAHEFLADFNLYNMNGRLYDPVVGRFLSPDPYVQNAGFTQNFNRYSYCLNNPLKYTDPNGSKYHFIEQTWWAPGAETFFGNSSGGGGSITPHLDKWNMIDMGQDASGGWRYDEATGGYYNLFSRENMTTGQFSSSGIGHSFASYTARGERARDIMRAVSSVSRSGNLMGTINSIEGYHFFFEIRGSYMYVPGTNQVVPDMYANVLSTLAGLNGGAQSTGSWSGTGGSWGDESFFGDAGFGKKALDWILAGGPVIDVPYYGGMAPTPVNIGSGLKGASTGLKLLYKNGVTGNSIINIRSTLLNNGFRQSLTRNRSGYLFSNTLGEQIRVMSRNGTWDIRVMNQYGNYLDDIGNVALPGSTHNLFIGIW